MNCTPLPTLKDTFWNVNCAEVPCPVMNTAPTGVMPSALGPKLLVIGPRVTLKLLRMTAIVLVWSAGRVATCTKASAVIDAGPTPTVTMPCARTRAVVKSRVAVVGGTVANWKLIGVAIGANGPLLKSMTSLVPLLLFTSSSRLVTLSVTPVMPTSETDPTLAFIAKKLVVLPAAVGESNARPKLTLVSFRPSALAFEAGPLRPANASTPVALIVIAVMSCAAIKGLDSSTPTYLAPLWNATFPDR